jgi:hypothetical protein
VFLLQDDEEGEEEEWERELNISKVGLSPKFTIKGTALRG